MRPSKFKDSKGRAIQGVRPSFRMHPDLYARALKAAEKSGVSFTDWIAAAVEGALPKGKVK